MSSVDFKNPDGTLETGANTKASDKTSTSNGKPSEQKSLKQKFKVIAKMPPILNSCTDPQIVGAKSASHENEIIGSKGANQRYGICCTRVKTRDSVKSFLSRTTTSFETKTTQPSPPLKRPHCNHLSHKTDKSGRSPSPIFMDERTALLLHYKYRTALPVPMFSRSEFSFWSILKQCIGKELSKITMPVVFNEPLSFIQRLAEYMEYAHLIDLANKCDCPVERLEYVSAFAVSSISSNWGRIGKPFNPLLGETYELDRPDLGFRFIGEQVSHHPPVTAFYAEGDGYSFHGSIQPKLKFWGKTVEISPKGTMTLELHKHREVYTWQNVNCNIHDIIVGQLWVEHSGLMEVTNNRNNLKASLNFKQAGWFAKELHFVEGHIYYGKKKERTIYGSWVKGLFSCVPSDYEDFMKHPENKSRQISKERAGDNSKAHLLSYDFEICSQRVLWKVNPRPQYSADYYNFTAFSMSLNELLPNMNSCLPHTDSRFRPDIRSMEDGKIDHSADEKNRVEEKQRDARKDRKKGHQEWKPLWFSNVGKDEWVFDKSYWHRDWKDVPDIF